MKLKVNLLIAGLITLVINFQAHAQNGLDFDGAGDYVQTTYSGISGTGARTVEAWVKVPLTTAPLNGKIVNWGANLPGQKSTFRIQSTNGTSGAIRYEINSGYIVGSTDIRDGLWHHVAVTWQNDGTPNVVDAKLYVDGVQETLSASLPWTVNTGTLSDFKIGTGLSNPTVTFLGVIDEVRVWNVARTQAQIAADTARELCVPQTGLVAYYQLNEGTAAGANTGTTIAVDSSGAANNGTLLGFSLTGATSNWVAGKTLNTCYPTCFGPTQTYVECDGFSVTVGSNTYTTTGIYMDTLTGVGCDSIVVTDLTINPIATFTQTFEECTGFTVTVGSNTYNTTGIYTDTLIGVTVHGCDSIVTTDLTVGSYKTTNQIFSECDGFTVTVGTNTYSTSGMYHDTLVGAATGGCDSIVNTDLTILNHTAATDTIVACDSYTWNGITYTSNNTTALDTLVNAAGCDSIVTLNLTINSSTSSVDVQADCDSYTWINGWTYTASNSTATHTLVNSVGCDSIVTLNLTITNSTSSTDVQTACGSYTWNGVTYTSSNTTAKDTLVNAVGCDSIITLNLTINPIYTTTDVQTVCDSLTWVDGVTYYSNNNTATYMTQSVSGCDSTATLNLTIINSSVFTDVIQACGSYTWIDGITYTTSNNTATDTLVSSNGCDSIVMLDLTVGQANSGSDIVTACDSLTWIDGNTYYSNTSNAYHTITNASGCDSVVRLFLTIKPIDVTTTNNWAMITANATGMSYQWMDCSDNSIIPGETGRSFVATANGSYKVAITDGTCNDTSACVTLTSVGIEEGDLNTEISLYPNPANDKVSLIIGENVGQVEIDVLDVSGKSHIKMSSDNKDIEIDLSKLESGVYFVRVVSNTGQKSKRLIKL